MPHLQPHGRKPVELRRGLPRDALVQTSRLDTETSPDEAPRAEGSCVEESARRASSAWWRSMRSTGASISQMRCAWRAVRVHRGSPHSIYDWRSGQRLFALAPTWIGVGTPSPRQQPLRRPRDRCDAARASTDLAQAQALRYVRLPDASQRGPMKAQELPRHTCRLCDVTSHSPVSGRAGSCGVGRVPCAKSITQSDRPAAAVASFGHLEPGGAGVRVRQLGPELSRTDHRTRQAGASTGGRPCSADVFARRRGGPATAAQHRRFPARRHRRAARRPLAAGALCAWPQRRAVAGCPFPWPSH